MDDEYFEIEGVSEDIMAQEYSVRERCQQLGISLENVRYRIGIDRFKWLSLLILLRFKKEENMFDENMIMFYYESVIPKIKKVEYKNALLCVLTYYICLSNTNPIKFNIDHNRLNFIQKKIMSEYEFLFNEHGVKIYDFVRYIRLFETTFSMI